MENSLSLFQELPGHAGHVTSLATTIEQPNLLISGSRDTKILIWKLNCDGEKWAVAVRSLEGHSHFVEDLVISSDGKFALSASCDKTLRLWDLEKGETTQRFVGHTNDVLSVSFSPDNRQIVSCGRDKTIKVWNVIGECKFNITDDGHTEWVSCVRFSPNPTNPLIVSAGNDKLIKVWELNRFKLKTNHRGHNGYLNTTAISPDGSLCASGGKDGVTMLWDLNDGKHLYSLEAGAEIHALCFSPNRYWLCAATTSGIKIWDLESKKVVADLVPEHDPRSGKICYCLSLTWSADGQYLFSGYTDKIIRVWRVDRN